MGRKKTLILRCNEQLLQYSKLHMYISVHGSKSALQVRNSAIDTSTQHVTIEVHRSPRGISKEPHIDEALPYQNNQYDIQQSLLTSRTPHEEEQGGGGR